MNKPAKADRTPAPYRRQQLSIKGSAWKLALIRAVARRREMPLCDLVVMALSALEEKVPGRFLPYASPEALQTLQPLTHSLYQMEKRLGRVDASLREISAALRSTGRVDEPDTGTVTPSVDMARLEEALRHVEHLRGWLRKMLSQIWTALR